MKSLGVWGNMLIVFVVILLAVVPFILKNDAAFEGADGQAEEVISRIAPNYQPWFKNLFEPPSTEVESLLFALQAAIGSGVLFYVVGYLVGSRKYSQEPMTHSSSAER